MAEPATQDPFDGRRRGPGGLDVVVGRPHPAATVVGISGELDTLTAPDLDSALVELTTRDDPRLVVDLSGVSFLASSGLGVLIQAAHRAGDSGRELHLVVRSRAVLRPLEVTGSDQLFVLHPDVDTALGDSDTALGDVDTALGG